MCIHQVARSIASMVKFINFIPYSSTEFHHKVTV